MVFCLRHTSFSPLKKKRIELACEVRFDYKFLCASRFTSYVSGLIVIHCQTDCSNMPIPTKYGFNMMK